jgi:hypothetical protein
MTQSVCCTHDGPAAPVELTSVLTCPACGAASPQTMPEDACLWFFTCPSCGADLRPLPGDCCVFCSYGSVPCPPLQRQRQATS